MSKFNFETDFFGLTISINDGFYVYLLLRPNGTPFYVGKGCGRRIDDHEKEASKGCECHKCRVIRKVRRNGGEIGKKIIFTTRNEAEAYRYEAMTIARFRSRIVNQLDYQPGWEYKQPARQRMTKARRKAEIDAKIERLTRTLNRLERQARYARLQGTLEERAQLKEEIDTLDRIICDLVWPPKQSTFLDEY